MVILFSLSVYKAQFPETFKETLTGEDHTKPVVGGIAIGLAAAVLFFAFLKTYSKYILKVLMSSFLLEIVSLK